MYTRCPSCRAEISFEPPANMESLPDGYKHRIKCPSCGVTIGVKINKIDTQATQLVQPAPAYNQPSTFDPVGFDTEENVAADTKKKADKRSGVGQNVTMMIMSLIFIAISVVGYLVNCEKIDNELFGIALFDGISYWVDLFQGADGLKLFFDGGFLSGILAILPMILTGLAVVNFITALVSACGKKYSRAYNLISSILIAAVAIGMVYHNILRDLLSIDGDLSIIEYFLKAIEDQYYMIFASAGLGVLQLILGLCFLASLERDKKNKKEKKARD